MRFHEIHTEFGVHPVPYMKSKLDFPYSFFKSIMYAAHDLDSFYFLDGNMRFPLFLTVGCGYCACCQESRRIDLVQRMQFEQMQYSVPPIFVTLTYNDLEVHRGIKKIELQKFFKRLRYFAKSKFRYFACGEYGRKSHRPHFHCIFFGLDWNELNDWFNQAWTFGFTYSIKVLDSSGGKNCFAYVAKYVVKSEQTKDVFQLWSKGLGSSYCSNIFSRLNLESYSVPELSYLDWFGSLQKVVINHWFLDQIFGNYARSTYSLRCELWNLYILTSLTGYDVSLIPEYLRSVHSGIDWNVHPRMHQQAEELLSSGSTFSEILNCACLLYQKLDWKSLDYQRVARSEFVSKFNIQTTPDYIQQRNDNLLIFQKVREQQYVL